MDRDLDHIEAHADGVLGGRAIVPCSDIALERCSEVAAIAVEVAEIVVAHLMLVGATESG